MLTRYLIYVNLSAVTVFLLFLILPIPGRDFIVHGHFLTMLAGVCFPLTVFLSVKYVLANRGLGGYFKSLLIPFSNTGVFVLIVLASYKRWDMGGVELGKLGGVVFVVFSGIVTFLVSLINSLITVWQFLFNDGEPGPDNRCGTPSATSSDKIPKKTLAPLAALLVPIVLFLLVNLIGYISLKR